MWLLRSEDTPRTPIARLATQGPGWSSEPSWGEGLLRALPRWVLLLSQRLDITSVAVASGPRVLVLPR